MAQLSERDGEGNLNLTTSDLGASSVGTSEIEDASIVNADVPGSAAIAYSKLNLASSILDTDVSDSDGTGGLYVKKFGTALYDFATDGGTAGVITLASTCTIPSDAIVTATHYDVITTCQSSGDAATIKLSVPTDGDLSTAIAINDGSNPWDVGAHLGSVITPKILKTTAARAVQVEVATENLTAGKIVFFIEYYVSETAA